MKTKKMLIILGSSDADTFCGELAERYAKIAESADHEVACISLGDLRFDPILHRGYKEDQGLEPDLAMVQEKFIWADHIVVIYPNWWCTMPALLKGLFDRIWLPGFAFDLKNEESTNGDGTPNGTGSRKKIKRTPKLTEKTARVIIVSGLHTPFTTWWKYGDYTNEIAHAILGFAGIKARVTAFGPSERVDEVQKGKWLSEIETLAKRGI